jgi:CelD/BcsL family acetyltransferase involved in cellulose biosynthesis
MGFYTLNPLTDSRWNEFLARHGQASIFHHPGWLEALQRTYDYEPVVLTTTPAERPLENGLAFCRVSSWVTGRRAVSLPFADHCEPLVGGGELEELRDWFESESEQESWRYIELRPRFPVAPNGWNVSGSYCFHTLDLSGSLEKIFSTLHKDSVQRRIRKAEREKLSYEVGTSERQVEDFYRLQVKTRIRHRLVPQPRSWFRNLVSCLGDQLSIQVARKKQVPIAALLTLRYRSTVFYKYGCSDEQYHSLGAMPFLFWNLIQRSKAEGVTQLDFGRSDWDQEGLIRFKDHFGTQRERLEYFRYSQRNSRAKPLQTRAFRLAFDALPAAMLPAAGRLLYRHIG